MRFAEINTSFLFLVIIFCLLKLIPSIAYSQNDIFEIPFSWGGGTRVEKQEPEFLSTYMAYLNDDWDIDISAAIFNDLHLTQEDIGTVFIIYPLDNYPDFVTFVDNLTNGINNRFLTANTFCNLGGGGHVRDEVSMIGHSTPNGIDLEGYQVNSISIYIDSLTISFDGTDWYDYSLSGRFEFDATLIDANLDGVPDDREVTQYSDLDRDGVNDSEQVDMRCLFTPDQTCEICIKIPPQVSTFGLFRTIDSENIVDTNQKPDQFPFGLLSFRMEVQKESTITLPIYFSQATPAGSKWFKYDPKLGWMDYSNFAFVSSDRKIVSLELTDGGHGDIDGRANAIIIDPSGPAIINNGRIIESEGGSSGCFISAILSNSLTEI